MSEDVGGQQFRIVRAFNNNVVAAKDSAGRDYVLMGKGLGFNASGGRAIAAADVDRLFRPAEGEAVERLVALLGELAPQHLEIADRIGALVKERLGVDVPLTFALPLADHIAMAIERAERGDRIQIPLVSEVSYTFPAETRVAQESLKLIEASCGVRLPDDEVAAIALHIVSASSAGGDIPTAMHLTAVVGEALQLIDQAFDVTVAPTSVATARFATHVRYLINRLQSGRQTADSSRFLWEAARTSHPREHQAALQIAELLSNRLDIAINREEELYLTLHVIRLVAES